MDSDHGHFQAVYKMRPPECRYSRTVHSWEFALDARQEDARTLEKPNYVFSIKERLFVSYFLLLPLTIYNKHAK